MSRYKYEADIYCPYYQSEGKYDILCEGCKSCDNIRLHFRRISDKHLWQIGHCLSKHPSGCPYREVMNKEYFGNNDGI